MKEITLDYLLNHKFELTGLEENKTKTKVSRMFSKNELGMLPRTDNEKYDALNVEISDMIHEYFKTSSNFEQKTNLRYETIRKYIRVGSGRTLTREMLAKFVIACNLPLNEANRLFELQGHELLPDKILLDAVIVHCLEHKHDLDEFFDTCDQVGLNIEYKI